MCDSAVILRLYSCVLHEHKIKHKVNEADIRTAIQNMKEVYKPNPGSLSDSIVFVADYNDAGHRCAYLHKYAPFHTALVADMLVRALQQNPKVFRDLIYPSGQINICSLGGGPGSDIFGVLSVLNAAFGLFQVSATVIDCMENWKDMFYELVSELRYGDYGALGECVDEQYFEWKYLQHNLLGKMTSQVNQSIARANLVTMIKFVSASSCKDTPAMIRKIFRTLKPGSLVLYIDNAGGGFHQVIRKEAQACNLITVFGPLKHHLYANQNFNVKRFGYTPCLETKVTVQIWRKSSQNINTHLELNEPSLTQTAVNVFPSVPNANQPRTVQTNNFEPKRQVQKSATINSRTIYDFPSPESVGNQRAFQNIPNASSQSVYEYNQRIIYAQSSYSYMPVTQASVTNHNFDTRRAEYYPSEPRRQIPKQSYVHSQPRSITSTRSEPERSQVRNRIEEDEIDPENDDCCACCVIS
ncbi:hypothetical protein AVEN_265687-1 [Araneus ventricosus]|uniref:Uncharacterized protein n=1 Tax=Araneus ventricosus TaxID=182803 RepID=A0A4Y2K9D5_ARAVE|nr:hypothetical protein AVEN_265687-1 [Araneus ventricosus]